MPGHKVKLNEQMIETEYLFDKIKDAEDLLSSRRPDTLQFKQKK